LWMRSRDRSVGPARARLDDIDFARLRLGWMWLCKREE
jgi:hypothetical protein